MAKSNLILTQSQWNEILKWIPSNEQEEQDKRILKYLQEASAQMKAKWPENTKKDEKKKTPKSTDPEVLRYEVILKADSAKRRQMIEEAERFVSSRSLKDCPIELKSAAILSENLYGRKLQLDFQAKQKKEEKAKTLMKNKLDMAQSIAWLNDGFEHRENAYRIALEHKKELLEMVNERKARRDEEKAKRIAIEQKEIEQHFKNIRDQKVRDRKAKEEQIEYMRKHEVETVLMAKQKREQIKRENEVIDVLTKVHNEGRNRIKELIKSQENQSRLERMKLSEKLGEMAKVRHVVENQKMLEEQKMIEAARLEKEKILDEIEKREKSKKKFLKNDRMQDYNQSLKSKEMKIALAKEEDKAYYKNRIINDIISKEYTKLRKINKIKRTMENLESLKQQAKEVRQQIRKEKEEDIKTFHKKIEEDTTDQKFFECAEDLLEDAKKKNRPIKPILQVVKSYKNRHFIDIKKRTRPHEISNVPIMEVPNVESEKGKTKRRIKYERDEKLMATNVYRSTKFLNVD